MSPQQEAVALWLYVESRGIKLSVRAIGRILRSEYGLKFRESHLRAWLAEFAGRDPDATGTQKSSTGDAAGTQPGRDFARAANVSLVSKLESSSSVLRTSSSSSHAENSSCAEGAEKTKNGRSLKLPLDLPLLEARTAIMRAIWQKVEPYLGRTTTWTSWRARNSRVASDLARGGYTPEDMALAWDLASRQKGEPVRELSQVRRFLDQVHTPRSGARR